RMNLEFQRDSSAPAKKSTTSRSSIGKNTSRIWSRCTRLNDVILSGVKRSRKDHDWPRLRRDPESGYPDFTGDPAAQLMRGRNSRRQWEKRQADEDRGKHTDQVDE